MKSILIIDDDITIRLAFKKLLKNDNYIIQQAKDVNEALSYLKNNFYNLVLLDLRLPPKGAEAGFRILAKKRKLPLNADTPVLIISGQATDREDINKRVTLEDNVADILIKPVENETLLKAVNTCLA